MGVYLYPNNTETELKNAYIGIPNPTSIVLDKSSITLTTIGQTEQLTATIEPTVSDKTITWASSDTTVATVSTTGLVTCVTPGDCTITATTVNGLTATCSVGQGRLPSAYQEVEYIQSSGTQYIRVGTQFKTNYKIVVDLQMDVIGGDYIPVGIRGDAGSTYRYGIDAWNGYFTLISGGSNWTNTIAEDTKRHTITIDKSIATIDGNNYNISYTAYTFTAGLGVFCYAPISDAPGNYSSNKLYKLDIYDENGTQINDLVPCYRKLDTEIGMYDLINNQFYTNIGTGTFTKGPDVN